MRLEVIYMSDLPVDVLYSRKSSMCIYNWYFLCFVMPHNWMYMSM